MGGFQKDIQDPKLKVDPCSKPALERFPALTGATEDPGIPGVSGVNCSSGPGLRGESRNGIGVVGRGGQLAGRFEGDVQITGRISAESDVNCTGNITTLDVFIAGADCAEDFDVTCSDRIQPGTVVTIGDGGVLEESREAYDKRVVGVISGAGGFRPGIVLDKQAAARNRAPVALTGKVYCKVDAQYGSVRTGDLLTTSATPGHAMKATDSHRAFGAVIGKALAALPEGRALVPIVVALQ